MQTNKGIIKLIHYHGYTMERNTYASVNERHLIFIEWEKKYRENEFELMSIQINPCAKTGSGYIRRRDGMNVGAPKND